MKVNKINIIADEFSNILINKVLTNEININEAINITSRILIMILGKTLPDNNFKECGENSNEISTQIIDVLTNLDNKYSIAEIAFSLNTVLEYFINN